MEIRYVSGVEGRRGRRERERVYVCVCVRARGMKSEWGLFLNFQISKR